MSILLKITVVALFLQLAQAFCIYNMLTASSLQIRDERGGDR